MGPVLEYVESRRVSTASPVPTSAQFLCSFASTITYGCCYPDDNDVWVNEHEDEDNEEEEAEVAFAVLLEQGEEVAAEASRASSSI